MRRIIVFAAAALLAATACAAAEIAEGPSWNISGDDWRCVKNCLNGDGQPTHVVQNGRQFRFISETGSSGYGEWVYNFFIEFVGCDNSAAVSADGRMITFGFGAVWAR
jgi:hypothetical protein